MKNKSVENSGFTLIELMITIAVFSLVMIGVYSVYTSQMRTHYVQQQIVDMQQNIRATMYLMEREIKMAGLNPTGAGGVGITVADNHLLEFNMDFAGGYGDGIDNDNDGLIDEGDNDLDDNANGFFDEIEEEEWYDGDTDDASEEVKYRLSNDDGDGNGINDGLPGQVDGDGGSCDLQRWDSVNNVYKTLALNIDALNFVYLDTNRNVLATPVADTSRIRSIQVTLVARSSATPSNYFSNLIDATSYENENPDGAEVVLPAQNDTYRRIPMTMEVTCRNMGL
jgi:type IV pilus assembly protein PilW